MLILWLIKKVLVLLGFLKPRILIFDNSPSPEWWDGEIKEKMEKHFEVKIVNSHFSIVELQKFNPDSIIIDYGLDLNGGELSQYLIRNGVKNSKFILWTIYYGSKNLMEYITQNCKVAKKRIVEKISFSNSRSQINKLFRLLRSMA